MQEKVIILKLLNNFLALFDLTILEQNQNQLVDFDYSNNTFIICDKDNNPVGKMFMDDSQIHVQANLENGRLNADSYANSENNEYGFRYTIGNFNSKSKLLGEYQFTKGVKLDGILIKNSIRILKNYKFVGKCTFDTLRNTFRIYDAVNNEKISYRNNELIHESSDKLVSICNYNGMYIYAILTDLEEGIGGCSFIKEHTDDHDYTACEIEFRRILEEIDETYFDLLDSQKEMVNCFQKNLFEKLACASLKNYNKTQLSSMLDIDFSLTAGYGKKKINK